MRGGVAVFGSYVYVADDEAGLRVINVADPAHPMEAGFYDTPGNAYGIAVSGVYAYVADSPGGLYILTFTGKPRLLPLGFTLDNALN